MTLRWLFLDLNSYFASVEQAEAPKLMGRPVAVVPTLADTTCCIAASYEAKKFGIKTGTLVSDAKRACRDIIFIVADHRKYTAYHKRILQAVDKCIPIYKVLSIDEMACELIGRECNENIAIERAMQVKETIYKDVSPALSCSIGLAPNSYLAKIASDMQKPNGLTIIHQQDLPHILYKLSIRDFPGIGPNMEQRFFNHRCTTVERMYQLSADEMRKIWGGICGEEFWHRIRGVNLKEKPTKKSSIGHSHVLPPLKRNHKDALSITVKLTSKCGVRLREQGLFCSELNLSVKFISGSKDENKWHDRVRFDETRDSITLIKHLEDLWEKVPKKKILRVGVTLTHLKPDTSHQLSIFEDRKSDSLMQAIDKINKKYKSGIVYSGSCHTAKDAAPARIAFSRIPEEYE